MNASECRPVRLGARDEVGVPTLTPGATKVGVGAMAHSQGLSLAGTVGSTSTHPQRSVTTGGAGVAAQASTPRPASTAPVEPQTTACHGRKRSGPRRRSYRKPFFQGWRVVAGAFLVLAAGYGAAYSFAAFAPALRQEFAASHGMVTLVYALCGFTAFSFSAVSGPLADRIGSRVLASVGMLLVGLGLWRSAAATTLLEVFFSYGLLIGLGIGFAYVPAVSAVQRWFVVRRGLASGIAASGIGFGTALVPPAVEVLIDFGGWRGAFLIAGGLASTIGLAGALLLARSPESRGLLPDGEAEVGGRTGPAEPPGLALALVLRRRSFALLYLGCFAVSVPVGLPFAHLPNFAHEQGVPWSGALALLSLVGIGSIAGRFLLGALADLAGRRRTFLGCCWGVAATTAWWVVAEGIPSLSGFALAFGAVYGGFVALLPAFAVDLFGRSAAGGILGVLYTSRALALLAGPSLVAATTAGTGLTIPVAACALVGAAGAVLLTMVESPRDDEAIKPSAGSVVPSVAFGT